MTEARFHAVRLGGDVIGCLVQHGDYTKFEWIESYWDNPERPILGLAFEDAPRRRCSAKMRLPAWFSNLLPEGILRTWIAQQRRVSPQREMELLAEIGHDLPGGAQLSPLSERPSASWDAHDFEGATVTEPMAPRDASHGLKFSLAGVGLKFSMLGRADRLTLPASDELGDWIVKMPDAVYPMVPSNEYATMSFAADVGIDVPQLRLVERDDLPELPDVAWPRNETVAYGIRRFDRDDGRRIHMEDLAQVRGFYPEEKYLGAFETVAALIHRGRDTEALLEFVRRLVFCFLVGNGDMHLKNWTLLYTSPTRPTLSPAYDLVATAPYAQGDGRTEDLGLKLAGHRSFDRVSRAAFARLAATIGADPSLVDDAVEQVLDATEAALPQALDRYGDNRLVQRHVASRVPEAIRQLRHRPE